MRHLLLALLILTAPALAKTEKKLNLKPQNTKNEDPGSATHLLYEPIKPIEGNSDEPKVQITQTCSDSVGMIYKKGDKGYDGCLRTKDLARPAENSRQRPSVGFTIGN